MDWIEMGVNSDADAKRVRNYVFLVARNLLCDRLARASAQKRGGNTKHFSVDDKDIAEKFHPKTETTPADEVQVHELQERWKGQVSVLENEAAGRGQRALFARMRASLEPGYGHANYEQTASDLGLNSRNVRVQACRWRTVIALRVRNMMEGDLAA
jgi:DNA-directed RNA polymerase specialized sigma24 family protein